MGNCIAFYKRYQLERLATGIHDIESDLASLKAEVTAIRASGRKLSVAQSTQLRQLMNRISLRRTELKQRSIEHNRLLAREMAEGADLIQGHHQESSGIPDDTPDRVRKFTALMEAELKRTDEELARFSQYADSEDTGPPIGVQAALPRRTAAIAKLRGGAGSDGLGGDEEEELAQLAAIGHDAVAVRDTGRLLEAL
jgi:hypothetical protein